MKKVLSLILGGGKGTRLFPLTQKRAKPAVPFAGKYRLVDIPISNCIHSGLKQIYILTQFNAASLNNHINHTYRLSPFDNSFVEMLSAEQTFEHSGWYTGTADAVRKNLHYFRDYTPTYYLILPGDQLYRMDLRNLVNKHIELKAEITVASKPVTRGKAFDLGVMKIDRTGRIIKFIEKPGIQADISEMKMPLPSEVNAEVEKERKEYLASMGIYIFNADTLEKVLDNNLADFGKEVLPSFLKEVKVYSYIFSGFWTDIGTIRSFYEANINLTSICPDFNFFDETKPIFTNGKHLPASKMNACTTYQSITSDGCIITEATIRNSVIGSRSIIEKRALLEGVVCMGSDYYESPEQKKISMEQGLPPIGIGSDSIIKKAIIDMNARIGEGCRIGSDDFCRSDVEYQNYCIKDGIIIITQDSIIPHGSVI